MSTATSQHWRGPHWALWNLMRTLAPQVERISPEDGRKFDLTATMMLYAMAQPETPKGPKGGLIVSNRRLARALMISRNTARDRLHALAAYGLIRVTYSWNDTLQVNDTSEIEINEIVQLYLDNRALKHVEEKRAIDAFLRLGSRRQGCDAELQGFFWDVPFGETEPPADAQSGPLASADGPTIAANPGDGESAHLMAQAQAEENLRKSKAEQAKQWMLYGKDFVDGCAKVWTLGQMAFGRIEQNPGWYGLNYNRLSAPNKQAYRALTSAMEQYGAYPAALAWYVFCSARHEIGPDGKMVFNKELIHRSASTADKNPLQFSKYLSSVMNDPIYKAAKEDPQVRIDMEGPWPAVLLNLKARFPTLGVPAKINTPTPEVRA